MRYPVVFLLHNGPDPTFTYNGNQVTKIEDSENNLTYNGAFNFNDSTNISDDYSYDKNGNLTKDSNKKIFSIQYNSLNLPSKINYSDGKTMDYVYSGTGEKKSVTYRHGKKTMTYNSFLQ